MSGWSPWQLAFMAGLLMPPAAVFSHHERQHESHHDGDGPVTALQM
jgi:hypothetical protein